MIADRREGDVALANAVPNLPNEKVLTTSTRNHHLELVVKRQISGLLLGLKRLHCIMITTPTCSSQRGAISTARYRRFFFFPTASFVRRPY